MICKALAGFAAALTFALTATIAGAAGPMGVGATGVAGAMGVGSMNRLMTTSRVSAELADLRRRVQIACSP